MRAKLRKLSHTTQRKTIKIPPWCPDPLGWYRDKPEDKRFYATRCIESEPLYVKFLDNGLVEVTNKCCKKKEHRVLSHEEFGQSVPPQTIVHIIEDTFFSSTKVIELENLSCGRFIVVSQDTTVSVFSFPKILHTIHPFLSLNHKSVPLLLWEYQSYKYEVSDGARDGLSNE